MGYLEKIKTSDYLLVSYKKKGLLIIYAFVVHSLELFYFFTSYFTITDSWIFQTNQLGWVKKVLGHSRQLLFLVFMYLRMEYVGLYMLLHMVFVSRVGNVAVICVIVLQNKSSSICACTLCDRIIELENNFSIFSWRRLFITWKVFVWFWEHFWRNSIILVIYPRLY